MDENEGTSLKPQKQSHTWIQIFVSISMICCCFVHFFLYKMNSMRYNGH